MTHRSFKYFQKKRALKAYYESGQAFADMEQEMEKELWQLNEARDLETEIEWLKYMRENGYDVEIYGYGLDIYQ